jgi:hypothetical protein
MKKKNIISKKELYKKCKCLDTFWEEIVIEKDNDYNNGHPSILYHCTNCGIDWAVEDKRYGFLIGKYIKSKKQIKSNLIKFSVSNIDKITIGPIIIYAPDKETARRRFWIKYNTGNSIRTVEENETIIDEVKDVKIVKKNAKSKRIIKKR